MRRSALKSLLVTIAVTSLLVVTLAWAQAARAQAPSAAGLGDAPLFSGVMQQSPCIGIYTKTVSPTVLLLGERTKIALRSHFVCPAVRCPLHLVFVLDGSGSMAGSPMKEMKQAAIELVRSLDMLNNPDTQVGIVAFNSQARAYTSLTNNEARVVSAIGKVSAGGGSAIDLGIREGLKVLLRGGSRGRTCHSDVMVVLSDGQNDAGCAPVLQAANTVKGQGILLITVCVSSRCDEQCMRQAATSPRYFYKVENARQLEQVLAEIRDRIGALAIAQLRIRDVLPDNMRLVPDSIVPDPEDVSVAGDVVDWVIPWVPRDGVTVSLEVEPLEPGYWPTNVEATGELWDVNGDTGTHTFSVPWVKVLEAQPHPTSAVTRTPSATPTPTPTSTPTPTATPQRPRPLYLPICYDEVE